MLYLEVQKGEEAMEKLVFKKDIGGTMDRMKRIMKATKGYEQLSSNKTFSWSWVSEAKISEESSTDRIDYCGPV